MSRSTRGGTVHFEVAPLGGLEKFVTVAIFGVILALGGGGYWAWQNVNEWGGIAGMAVSGVLLFAPFLNRLRIPDTYEVSQTALRVLVKARELERISFADLDSVEVVDGPYFPHRSALDLRSLYAEAFGWNGKYASIDFDEHRLLGTNLTRAVVLRGKDTWVVTPTDPAEFVRAVEPRLKGKRRR